MTDLPFQLGRGHGDLDQIIRYMNDSGGLAHVVQYQTGAYAEGETIRMGNETIEIVVLNDNSGATTANNDFNKAAGGLSVDMSAYAQLDPAGTGTGTNANRLRLGELVLIQSEILRVTKIEGSLTEFARAQMGTSAAAHANGQNIVVSSVFVHGTNHPVAAANGTSVTAEAIGDALRVVINSDPQQGPFREGGFADLGLMETTNAGAELVWYKKTTGADTRVCSETGANSALSASAFAFGENPKTRRTAIINKGINAAEVTAGKISIPVDFVPGIVLVQLVVEATNAIADFNGDVRWHLAADGHPAWVEINNDGDNDFAATHTLRVFVAEN